METNNTGYKHYMNRFTNVIKQASVEPFVFFFMLGYYVKQVTFQSLLMDRTCRIKFDYGDDICDHLSNYKQEQAAVVKYSNNMFLGVVLLATLPAFLISIFVGPWSDKYGRKIPLIVSCSGVLIDTSLGAFVTSIPTAPPTLFLASQAISGISGGLLVTLSQTYSYLSDITHDRTRPIRFAILEFFFIMSVPLGTMLGGKSYEIGGYITVMILSPCAFACALLYLIFVLKETKVRNADTTKTQMLREFFKLDNFKENFITCMKKRPGNLRLQIWLLVVVSCTSTWISIGTISIGFPYASVMFDWGVTEYANMTTIFYVLDAIAMITLVPTLSKKFMLHEAAMGLIGVFSLMAKMVVLSVAVRQELVAYAWFCGILHACIKIAVRSRISKLVSKQELGRVFSLLATCEAVMPVLGTTVMTRLYNASVEWYPGLSYAIAASILVPSAIIFGWMTRLPTMSFVQYQEMEDFKVMKEMKDVSNYL